MFKDNFCASPWFHMRMTNSGDYRPCRWTQKSVEQSRQGENIRDMTPLEYFQQGMSSIRQDLLQGRTLDLCKDCHVMESHGKVSGRQKQLLKTGVTLQDFNQTMLSSPWIESWKHSMSTRGHTDLHVQDWQIDLGNFCNSACVFCDPGSSSRLASEFYKLKLISDMPPRPWCDDPDSLSKFIDTLSQSPSIRYIHFIGGETLITPAFKQILTMLVEKDLCSNTAIGFTTNLTVMDPDILDLLDKFDQVNLGVSIECLDRVNDYVRFGSEISAARSMMDTWVEISKQRKWFMQIRTTPTILSVARLVPIYEYAWQNMLTIESCNFIDNPVFMRPSVLPGKFRRLARDELQKWIDSKSAEVVSGQIINTRHPGFAQQQILQDATSYVKYFDQEPDLSHLLPKLVEFLKLLDHNRSISVLDYLPEYEELFRSAGY